jgi:hypothetical protein
VRNILYVIAETPAAAANAVRFIVSNVFVQPRDCVEKQAIMANPENPDIEPINFEHSRHLGVHRQTHALYWNGAEVVTRSRLQLRGRELALAIIIAGALIAAAIALTNHWSFDPGPQGGTATLLNRWTGRVIVCGGHVLVGWEIPCPVQAEIPK